MTEDIKGLIEKINQEGVQAAEARAGEIEKEAEHKAEHILTQAIRESERMVAEAEEKIKAMGVKQKQLLNQASRDFLLSLRKEISETVGRLVIEDVRQALSPEAMYKILAEVIKKYEGGHKAEAVVSLKAEDAKALEKHYLTKLKEETKKGITLKPSGEITGGFTISFDAGRSQFDFTDSALADYIGTYLKPQLGELLKQADSK